MIIIFQNICNHTNHDYHIPKCLQSRSRKQKLLSFGFLDRLQALWVCLGLWVGAGLWQVGFVHIFCVALPVPRSLGHCRNLGHHQDYPSYRFLSRHQYHLVIVNVVINSVSSIRLKVLVTTDVTSILLRMNEIVDAANISQLNSNAPAVFPMGVRLGTLLQCSCCSRCLWWWRQRWQCRRICWWWWWWCQWSWPWWSWCWWQ